MPYITQEERLAIAQGKAPETPGQLNYLISTELWKWCLDRNYVTRLEQVILTYLFSKPISYANFNEVIGVLGCVYREFKRRSMTVPYLFHIGMRIRELEDLVGSFLDLYEDVKIKQNGEIFI